MGKETYKNNVKQKSTTSKTKNHFEIDALIEKILLENKEKLDKINSKEIDKEQFSLKNKRGNTIYYLKKKSSKTDKDSDYEEIRKEIIPEARENLGKEPLVKEEEARELKISEENPEQRNDPLGLEKNPKKIDDKIIGSPKTDETNIDYNELDEVVAEYEKKMEDPSSKPIDNKSKDSGIIKDEAQKSDGSIQTPTSSEKKDEELSQILSVEKKKSDDSSQTPASLEKEEDEISEILGDEEQKSDDSSQTPASLEKKDDEVSNILSVEKKKSDDSSRAVSSLEKEVDETIKKRRTLFGKKQKTETKLDDEKSIEPEELTKSASQDLDINFTKPNELKVDPIKTPNEEIKSAPEISDTKEIDKEKSEEDLGASKSKSSFFKSDKSSDDKTTNLDKKETQQDESLIKPTFRVDNLPEKEGFEDDEASFLDEKIKESPMKDDDSPAKTKAEIKAILLAEEHIKEKKMVVPEKEKELDISIPKGVPLTSEDSDHEHVFFDEEDASFEGWTPKTTDKEKKDIASNLEPQGEIDIDDQKGVGDLELPTEVLKTKSVTLADLGFSKEEWEELDFYSLDDPFASVEILREKESLDKCYFLVEVALTEEEEKLMAFIKDTIASLIIDTEELDEKGYDAYLIEMLDTAISEYDIKISDESRKKIYYFIGKSSLGLGKIDPLLKDPNIEDISCDGANVPVFLYHRKYGSLKSNVRFDDEEELSSFIFKLAQKCGKHISIAEPMLDATMPDGSRIQMTLSDEITAKGSTFTIRKFRSDPFSPPDLVEFNTMSSEMIAYMWLAVENGINTLFAGGTASGKTTTMNALTLFIPRESKIVSIEETREINLPHPNWIPGVARSGFGEVVADKMVGEIDMYDLMKAALRQRPEYIIVGEIRGREAYVLFQAMATGHATYSTAHADSAQSLIHRLEGKPINIPRVMLQSLDIVCLHVITRVKDVRARRCKQIIEIIDIDPTTKEILTNEVFHWDPIEDKFIYSGKSYVLERIRAEKDMSREDMTEELRNRMIIVEWMNKNNIREFRDVSKLVAQYLETPKETLSLVEKDVKK